MRADGGEFPGSSFYLFRPCPLPAMGGGCTMALSRRFQKVLSGVMCDSIQLNNLKNKNKKP